MFVSPDALLKMTVQFWGEQSSFSIVTSEQSVPPAASRSPQHHITKDEMRSRHFKNQDHFGGPVSKWVLPYFNSILYTAFNNRQSHRAAFQKSRLKSELEATTAR